MTKNKGKFPLDESGDPLYPECQVCPKHPSIADCAEIDICSFEFCEQVIERYPEDFSKEVGSSEI